MPIFIGRPATRASCGWVVKSQIPSGLTSWLAILWSHVPAYIHKRLSLPSGRMARTLPGLHGDEGYTNSGHRHGQGIGEVRKRKGFRAALTHKSRVVCTVIP